MKAIQRGEACMIWRGAIVRAVSAPLVLPRRRSYWQ
jgi:hypothetical protein